MAKSPGRDGVLSIWNGSAFIVIGGLRAKSIKLDQTNVDITTADSSGRWREMINGAGVRSVEIDGAGMYDRDPGIKLALAAFNNSALATMRFAHTGIGMQIDGAFIIDSISIDSPYDGAAGYSIKVSSAGAITLAVT
jgi:TP901-1 family phage major tail protein